MSRQNLSPNSLISFVVIAFVLGLLSLSFIYEEGRIVFFDLSKVVLGAYVGYQIPSPRE